MKGGLRLLLLLGFAAIGLLFVRGLPRSVTLVYDLEDAAAVRELSVDVRQDGSVLRHAEYRFPSGAPRQVQHAVRLPDGSYDLQFRISRDPGAPWRAHIPLVVSESGAIVLPVRPGPGTPAN